jgi:hypothetical protein
MTDHRALARAALVRLGASTAHVPRSTPIGVEHWNAAAVERQLSCVAVSRPLRLRDGRQLWRLPGTGSDARGHARVVRPLLRRAFGAGVALVPDDRTLIIIAPRDWPAGELPALAAQAGAVIDILTGRDDMRAGSHRPSRTGAGSPGN